MLLPVVQTYRCHSRKVCYPTKQRWMLYIMPGIVIAVIGLITFAFFETSRNYKYTHSVWHACMALCIVFILPPRCEASDKDGTHLSLLSFLSTLLLPTPPVLHETALEELDAAAIGSDDIAELLPNRQRSSLDVQLLRL